jgi:hypothetical protein
MTNKEVQLFEAVDRICDYVVAGSLNPSLTSSYQEYQDQH